jgi:hypothetical protein
VVGAGWQTLLILFSFKPSEGLMTQWQQRRALTELCDTSNWSSVVSVTLNLKQAYPTCNGGFMVVDDIAAKKAFRNFMNRLNRLVYGSANRHYDKRLRVIPILEKSKSGRWHYHAAIEPPIHMTNAEFRDAVTEAWQTIDLSYGYGDITFDADAGWISYITKFRTKDVFEHYFDSIDTDAFFNPVASA